MEVKVEELEKRLARSDKEVDSLKEIIKEIEDAKELLESKCRGLENTIKLEKKKRKKERQKADKKIQDPKLKIESTDDEEIPVTTAC